MLAPYPIVEQLKNYHFPEYPTVTGLPQPITAHSLGEFFGALAWGALLLVAFAGWGRTTGRLFRVQRLPASVACSLGIATIIFIGGWLNLLHLIYPSFFFVLVAIGLALYLWLRSERLEEYGWLSFWNNSSRWSQLLVVITIVILMARVAATAEL